MTTSSVRLSYALAAVCMLVACDDDPASEQPKRGDAGSMFDAGQRPWSASQDFDARTPQHSDSGSDKIEPEHDAAARDAEARDGEAPDADASRVECVAAEPFFQEPFVGRALRTPLEELCARLDCPATFQAAVDSAWTGSFPPLCLFTEEGCGVDSVTYSWGTHAAMFNYAHDSGDLIGTAYIDDISFAEDGCEYDERQAGEGRGECADWTGSRDCDSPDGG